MRNFYIEGRIQRINSLRGEEYEVRKVRAGLLLFTKTRKKIVTKNKVTPPTPAKVGTFFKQRAIGEFSGCILT